ncbi:hypothetical protein SY94_1550 [Agrobacterium tumefaciens]|nr:hypothetical protein SY94_1550 [Agrobacterium tumefaciens]
MPERGWPGKAKSGDPEWKKGVCGHTPLYSG